MMNDMNTTLHRSHDVCTCCEEKKHRNQHANLAGTRHVATQWPTWQRSSCSASTACHRCRSTICIALHRIALRFLFAPRRTTLAHVREFVHDRNHIANLAGPQHVGTRWRTLRVPKWQTNRYFRGRHPLFLASGNRDQYRHTYYICAGFFLLAVTSMLATRWNYAR